MSRSYKKTPVIKDNGHGAHRRWNKRQANRVVRNADTFDISGKAYRKLYCSWNIYDYISYNPWIDEVNSQYNNNPFWVRYSYRPWYKPEESELRNKWEKWYRRK